MNSLCKSSIVRKPNERTEENRLSNSCSIDFAKEFNEKGWNQIYFIHENSWNEKIESQFQTCLQKSLDKDSFVVQLNCKEVKEKGISKELLYKIQCVETVKLRKKLCIEEWENSSTINDQIWFWMKALFFEDEGLDKIVICLNIQELMNRVELKKELESLIGIIQGKIPIRSRKHMKDMLMSPEPNLSRKQINLLLSKVKVNVILTCDSFNLSHLNGIQFTKDSIHANHINWS